MSFKEISRKDTQTIKEQIRKFQENTREVQELLEDFEAEPQNLSEDRGFQKSREEAKAIFSSLYELLINNYLKEEIENYNRLTISPDGLLNLLPFDALYDGEEYLLNKIDIYYIFSGRELVRINRFGIDDKISKKILQYLPIQIMNMIAWINSRNKKVRMTSDHEEAPEPSESLIGASPLKVRKRKPKRFREFSKKRADSIPKLKPMRNTSRNKTIAISYISRPMALLSKTMKKKSRY